MEVFQHLINKEPAISHHRLISAHEMITMQDIVDNPQMPWCPRGIARNPNLTPEYYKLADICTLSGKKDIPWDYIISNAELNWDWAVLSRRADITLDIFNSAVNKWRIDALSANPNLPFEIVETNMHLPWNWNLLSGGKVPVKFVAEHCHEVLYHYTRSHRHKVFLNWNYFALSTNPNITWQDIQNNPRIPWHWSGVAQNPNITWEIVQEHMPDYASCFARNPNMTLQIALDHPEHNWVFWQHNWVFWRPKASSWDVVLKFSSLGHKWCMSDLIQLPRPDDMDYAGSTLLLEPNMYNIKPRTYVKLMYSPWSKILQSDRGKWWGLICSRPDFNSSILDKLIKTGYDISGAMTVISAHDNIFWEDVIEYNVAWDFKAMSTNHNITWQIVMENDRPWDYIALLQNPMNIHKKKLARQLLATCGKELMEKACAPRRFYYWGF